VAKSVSGSRLGLSALCLGHNPVERNDPAGSCVKRKEIVLPVKILFLAGSTRKGSFNRRLARAAAAEARDQDADVTHIELSDYELPIYNADFEAVEGLPENAIRLKELFRTHRAIFFASPEYNAGVTPLLKNTLDWISRKGPDEATLRSFRGNVFAIASASTGAFAGMRGLLMLRQILMVGIGAQVIPEQVSVARANDGFAEDGSLKDERAAAMLTTQIARLIAVAEALYPGK
jgi:chromate reductase, NAD(P)H dehydrogenase (quinone)